MSIYRIFSSTVSLIEKSGKKSQALPDSIGISFLGQLLILFPTQAKEKWINVCVCLFGSVAKTNYLE